MILGVIVQQPSDVIDYSVNYAEWAVDHEDPLMSVDFNIIPSDGTLNVNGQLLGDSKIQVWVQGGAHGDAYTVEINATFQSGRSKQSELLVQIEDYK